MKKIIFSLFIVLSITLLTAYSFTRNTNQMNKSSQEKLKIEIWSDVVCPFCYIGKKKLEKAIAKLGIEDKVEIIWHSFQLDPDFPMGEAHPSMEYLAEHKRIPMGQLQQMTQQLTAQAKPYGIDFHFDKALTFNTINAHSLWQWTKEFGKTQAYKDAVMKAYFTDGINLAEENNLLDIITKIGLDKELASKALKSDQYSKAVYADIKRAEELGIRGVPYFLIDGKASISGAQDDKIFEQVLTTALAE